MAGDKETYQIDLNPDQMAFVQSAAEKYGLPDADKALRVIMDYLMTNPEVHDAVFSEPRCLRCG